MAATALRTLLLLLPVWRGGAICTSTSYTAFPGMAVSGVTIYPEPNANAVTACHLQCNTNSNCYGYMFHSSSPDGNKCQRILSYFEFSMVYATGQTSSTLYRRDCPFSTIPPPTPSTRIPPPPPTRPTPPPTAPPPCPPDDGLSTGMVILIAVFTAFGGIILGMLLASKCCPIGHGGSWFNVGNHPPHCLCQKCKPVHGSHSCNDPGCTSCHKPPPLPPPSCEKCHVPGCTSCHKPAPVCHSCSTPGCTSCHQVAPPSCTTCHIPSCTGCHLPQHLHPLHQKPGPIFPALPPSGGVTPGQTFSVAASPYNDVYTVSLSGN